MTLGKGNFKVWCDEPGCDEVVDLETDDFQDAIRSKHSMLPGWGSFKEGDRFTDYCPAHREYDNRAIRRGR